MYPELKLSNPEILAWLKTHYEANKKLSMRELGEKIGMNKQLVYLALRGIGGQEICDRIRAFKQTIDGKE